MHSYSLYRSIGKDLEYIGKTRADDPREAFVTIIEMKSDLTIEDDDYQMANFSSGVFHIWTGSIDFVLRRSSDSD